MSKQAQLFRLSEDTADKLNELVTRFGYKDKTEVVESAILHLHQNYSDLLTHIKNVYNVVFEEIQSLENQRDYTPRELTAEENEFLNLLNRTFDDIRRLKSFSEPQMVEDEFGNPILGPDGQPQWVDPDKVDLFKLPKGDKLTREDFLAKLSEAQQKAPDFQGYKHFFSR